METTRKKVTIKGKVFIEETRTIVRLIPLEKLEQRREELDSMINS